MGTPRDVIVSAFATPPGGMRELAQDLRGFKEAPEIVEVPFAQYMRSEDQGMAAAAFSRAAAALRQEDGSVLGGLLRRYARGFDVRSLTLVGFSAGGVFLHEVMRSPDVDRVDAVVCLDSLVFNVDWRGEPWPQEIEPWLNFAVKASQNTRLLVVAHTDIPSPAPSRITSTKSAAETLIRRLSAEVAGDPYLTTRVPPLDMDSFFRSPPPPPVTITAGPAGQVQSRVYEESPVDEWHQWGNCWTFSYTGSGPADHVYVAWYGQRDIWQGFLVPRLNTGIQCASGTSGLGQAEEEGCRPSRKLVGKGVYPTGSYLWTVAAVAGGIAAGTTAGYLFGRNIGE